MGRRDLKEDQYPTAEPTWLIPNKEISAAIHVANTLKHLVGWIQDGNGWPYENGDGELSNNEWKKIDGDWYYFDSDGHCLTGWQYIGNDWYFFGTSGCMQTGWQEINGEYYYFDGSGHMLRNSWVDNCYLGSNGAWKADIPSGSKQFYVAVNCQENTVTIYVRDSHGYYTIPYKAMVCSGGLSDSPTPTGVFYPTGNQWKWLCMVGDVWGIYVTQIQGNYLFHSVPYTEYGNHGSLQEGEFDKLGQPASHGCIRLQIKDAKWIYDNISHIDTIKIFNSSDPGPLGKPIAPKIADSAYPGWDPTDTDPDNPWLNVTALRATCADLIS